MTIDDESLRARFDELKRHDRRDVPEFRPMWSARPPRSSRSAWRAIVPAASLAAAAMVVLWCGARAVLDTARAPEAAATHGGEAAQPLGPPLDPAPLDFLLDVPSSAPAAAMLETRAANAPGMVTR